MSATALMNVITPAKVHVNLIKTPKYFRVQGAAAPRVFELELLVTGIYSI